jgi:hypothetical protein
VVKQFADEQHFPIIIFEEPVSFIEITQDIHTRLIAKHQDQLLALERISTQFLQLTLQPQGLKKILQLLHKETALVVWLEDYLEKTFIYPEDEKPVKKNSICRPITVLDVHIGNLYIRKDRELTEYLNLILDRAIIAIAQERLRQILMEEWEMKEGRKWMIDFCPPFKKEMPWFCVRLSVNNLVPMMKAEWSVWFLFSCSGWFSIFFKRRGFTHGWRQLKINGPLFWRITSLICLSHSYKGLKVVLRIYSNSFTGFILICNISGK